MSVEYKLLQESLDSIKDKIPFKPDVALVLGTGLSNFPNDKEIFGEIYYKDIKNFPVSKVAGHNNRYLFLKVGGKNVVCMQGRVHYYEGFKPVEVVRPIRLMKLMGAESLILSTASGGMNNDFNIGDIMLIKDHISFFVPNPLVGENVEELGDRFIDISEVYNREYIKIIKDIAKEQKLDLKEGVFAQIQGPTYETQAEVFLLHRMKIDAVSMSTVMDATAAAHMKMKTAAFSIITDVERDNGVQEVVDHETVQKAAKAAEQKFIPLIEEFIKRI